MYFVVLSARLKSISTPLRPLTASHRGMTSADSSTSNSPRTSISSFSLGGLLSGNVNFSEAAAKGSIVQRLSPLLPVIASPLADKHCEQFGLKTFADFLLPFGKSNDGKGTFSTVAELV